MKGMDLALMMLTFNITFFILQGIGCFSLGSTVNLDAFAIAIGLFVATLTAGVAASSVFASWFKPLGVAFAVAFTGIWTANIYILDGIVHFTNPFPWLSTLLILIIGPLLGIIGAYEMQSGVKI